MGRTERGAAHTCQSNEIPLRSLGTYFFYGYRAKLSDPVAHGFLVRLQAMRRIATPKRKIKY
jgi:hypothetical protein